MRRTLLALCCVGGLVVAACGGDDSEPAATAPAATDPTSPDRTDATTSVPVTFIVPSTDDAASSIDESSDTPTGTETGIEGDMTVADGQPFPDARCAENRSVGTITFLTSFDFAAAASIVDVVVAEDRGYYDEMCLDVEIVPSLSTDNYPLVAAGTAQFSSGGSFAEVAAFAANNEADLTVLLVDGNVPIDVLMVKDGQADDLGDLEDATIGVQGRTPMSIAAMMASEGLVDNEDFTSVPLAGFDAAANIEPDTLAGITGYKSNEVGQLEGAGIDVTLFDPADYDVPGSFGVVYTSADYLAEHPTVVEDFTRATLRGLADALAEPAAAAELAITRAEAGGNAFFLSLPGETFRWTTESSLVESSAIEGEPLGTPDVEALQAELDAYAPFGLFGDDDTPDASALVEPDVIASVHDGDSIAWPA